MATIEKLKMRRLQFMKDQEDNIADQTTKSNLDMGSKSPALIMSNKNRYHQRSSTNTAKQSCNVITTATIETEKTIEDELNHEARQHDVSFTEALNKLKVEVENLML